MDNCDLTETRGTVISSNRELTSGECVKAYYKDTLVHRGEVTDIAPNPDLFWLLDVLTGSRKLVDIAELEIVRAKAPAQDPHDSKSLFTLPS
jgi:hypothetical protein